LDEGTKFEVLQVLIGGEVGKRLADMGFTEGAQGALIRGTFLRDPLQIRIRDYDVLIRRSEAHLIEVRPILQEQQEQEKVTEEAQGITNDTQRTRRTRTKRRSDAGGTWQKAFACRFGGNS
jgi:Fe2+ transport system protein FeoA